MIFDPITNIKKQLSHEGLVNGLEFLENISKDMEPGEYSIDGDKCFARVMECVTSREGSPENVIESHQKYADIHVLLTGEERIDWFSPEMTTIKTPYSVENDVTFYHLIENPYTSIPNRSGHAIVFFPSEIHRPQIAPSGLGQKIKKVVVKVLMEK